MAHTAGMSESLPERVGAEGTAMVTGTTFFHSHMKQTHKKKRRSFLWRDRQPATHPPKKADKRICQRETLPLCVNPKVCNSASVRYSCTIRYQVRYRISNTTIAHILFNELPFTLLIITKQRQNVLPPSDHIWTWLTSGRETTQLLFTSRLFTSPPDPTTYRIKTRVDYSYYLNICSIYFQFI